MSQVLERFAKNKCGTAGLGLSLIGLLLGILAISIPRFVDVFIISNVNQIDGSNPVAGVGIFKSEYDAGKLDADVLTASGVPDGKFNTPTLEFPLLFPAQENFVADVVPFEQQDMIALDTLLQAEGTLSSPLNVLLDNLDNLGFESCTTYVDAVLVDLEAVFVELQENTLPATVLGINEELVSFYNAEIQSTIQFTGPLESNIAHQLMLKFLTPAIESLTPNFSETCAALGIIPSTVVQGTVADCMSQGFDVVAGEIEQKQGTESRGILPSTLRKLGAIFGSNCENTGVTVSECLEVVFYEVQDTTLLEVVAFAGADVDSLTFCKLMSDFDCGDTSTKSDYFLLLKELFIEDGSEITLDAATALSIYLTAAIDSEGLFDDLQVDPNLPTAQASVTNSVDSADFPQRFSARFDSCTFIQLFSKATGVDLNVSLTDTPCIFGEYWRASSKLLTLRQSALAPITQEAEILYEGCEAEAPLVGICPTIFPLAFLDGAFGGGIGLTLSEFSERAVLECEDDVIDNEKIATAQRLVIPAILFHCIAGISGILVFVDLGLTPIIFECVAAGTALLAGIFIIAALLTVRSAPVYQGVGEEPSGEVLEPFFQEGSVVLLSVFSALFMFVATGCYVAAVTMAICSTRRAPVAETEMSEVKNSKFDQKPSEGAKSKPEAKPSKASVHSKVSVATKNPMASKASVAEVEQPEVQEHDVREEDLAISL